MKDDYVYKHVFGYGETLGDLKINKLQLRNIQDCKDYLQMICAAIFDATYYKNILTFKNGAKYLISLEME